MQASRPSAAAQSLQGLHQLTLSEFDVSQAGSACTPTVRSAATLPLLVALHRKAASGLGFCVLGVGPWWCEPLDQPPALKNPDQLLDL